MGDLHGSVTCSARLVTLVSAMTTDEPSLITLETDRLRLRPLHEGDEEAVYTLLSDERVVRYMLFPVFTRERAHAFVSRVARAPASGQPSQLVLAMAGRSDDALIGLTGLVLKPELEEGEVWYLLHPDRWGQGLVTEGVRQLVRHGFDALNLHRIWASCLPENPGSARVLEKLGFRREGLLRQNLRIHGEWKDSYLYAALTDEWAKE